MFSNKLTFLMNLTNTRNNVLARALNVDASYISLLKNGKRVISEKSSYYESISQYFAKFINDDYKLKALAAAIDIIDLPNSQEEISKIIYEWLTKKEDYSKELSIMLSAFSSPSPKPSVIELPNTNVDNDKLYYYGQKGKQDAVVRFLTEVYNTEKPQTLLLFSDEDMSWIYKNSDYAAKWAKLLIAVLLKGNKIKIIHSITRNMEELLQAVIKWVPVYASGLIEPYYYPDKKDGIFQHTFFIAPDTKSAIVSSAVMQNVDGMLNIFINDAKAIKSLMKEFNNYLSLCKPLMQISNAFDFAKTEIILDEFFDTSENIVIVKPDNIKIQNKTLEKFNNLVCRKNITLFENIKFNLPNNIVLCYRENYGVLLIKLENPEVIFCIEEKNMIKAFGMYLKNKDKIVI